MMKGYKVFRPDWTCRDFKYEVGKTYEIDGELRMCDNGFHFCERAADCFKFYDFDSKNKVAEVEALGEILTDEEKGKSCTSKIRIIRELNWYEVLNLVNTGRDCTGYRNTGDCNTGDWNTGNRNTGYRNTGNRNTGNCNTGNCNTGNRNTGDRNTGDWNYSNFNSGCFNTVRSKILLFDKPSEWTYQDWFDCDVRRIMSYCPYTNTEWIDAGRMTDEERAEHPGYATIGGYLKTIMVEDKDKQAWWDALSEEDKETVMNLPNFDKDKFKKCTGIEA